MRNLERYFYRLTTVESRMLEKDFEISKLKEENDTLKETMENITRASAVKTEQGEKTGNSISFACSNCLGGPSLRN